MRLSIEKCNTATRQWWEETGNDVITMLLALVFLPCTGYSELTLLIVLVLLLQCWSYCCPYHFSQVLHKIHKLDLIVENQRWRWSVLDVEYVLPVGGCMCYPQQYVGWYHWGWCRKRILELLSCH